MQDHGDCVAVDATELTEIQLLLSDSPDSRLLAMMLDVLTVAVVVNELSAYSTLH